MSDLELKTLLIAMEGAQFDEFTFRKTSSRMTFSKNFLSRRILFLVETNSHISLGDEKKFEYEEAILSSVKVLYGALEETLISIIEVKHNLYKVSFGNGANIYLADFEQLWDNVFSVRTEGWPEANSREHYYFGNYQR